jgi:hypothetical protein
MLQWEIVDVKATWPSESYHAENGRRDHRIFFGPEAASHPDLPWILVVRETGEGEVQRHIHHGNYRTVDEAKRAAEQWVE